MRILFLTAIMALICMPLPASAATEGASCSTLGMSQISSDRTAIVVCLLVNPNTASNASCSNTSGGCLWVASASAGSSSDYNYEIISAGNGTTYTRTHKGTVRVTYSGVSHQAGYGHLGFQYFFNGGLIASWGPAVVNYQAQSSPSYTYIAKVNGSFNARMYHWPSLVSGRIVIEYLD